LNQELRKSIRFGALVGHDAVPPCRRGFRRAAVLTCRR
jgi:hypothetical protein